MEAKAITSSFLPADNWHSHGIQHTWDCSVVSVYSPKSIYPWLASDSCGEQQLLPPGTDWASLWPPWVPGSWAAQELPLSFSDFDSPALPSALETPKPSMKPLPSWNTKVFSVMSEPSSWAIFPFISIRCHCSK